MRTRRARDLLVRSAAAVLLAAAAAGQDSDALRDLARLHDKIVRAGTAASVEQGEKTLQQLDEWGLSLSSLTPAQRGRALRVEIHAALAVGDALLAADRLAELQAEFPQESATLSTAYLVACANGDAKLGLETLKKMPRPESVEVRRRRSRRRVHFRDVGKAAPAADIRIPGGKRISVAERDGVVLLIDFWSLRSKPSGKQAEALRALHEEYKENSAVRFVGVNADSKARVDDARTFAQEYGYSWPQHYEKRSSKAPLTRTAFKAGTPPWQVIVDQRGLIRFVGSATDAGFHYALRAAVLEASGKYAGVTPRTRKGEQAKVAAAQPKANADKGQAHPESIGKGDLPSNREARGKLTRARLFWRTWRRRDARRLFEEIVRDYPGTREAREAQEWLDSIP